MKTIRFLEDNNGVIWKVGDFVKVFVHVNSTSKGVIGCVYIGSISVVGVNMITLEIDENDKSKYIQILDLDTILSIQSAHEEAHIE